MHDFLFKCVEGHCNIIVSGETGSGKTELVKYLASHTKENEKIITIEDTLELHLDKIFPHRDIVAMKTNNIASYSDVLVTCMRQNPRWILLSEVRSAEAVQFLKTIHRYIHLGVHVKGYMSKKYGRFQREIVEVAEFYVDDDNEARCNVLYSKGMDGVEVYHNPSKRLLDYLDAQGIYLPRETFVKESETLKESENIEII